MDHQELRRRFAALTTAHLADACIRVRVPVRCAPAPMRAVVQDGRLAGRAVPARHVGSWLVLVAFLIGAAYLPDGSPLLVDVLAVGAFVAVSAGLLLVVIVLIVLALRLHQHQWTHRVCADPAPATPGYPLRPWASGERSSTRGTS